MFRLLVLLPQLMLLAILLGNVAAAEDEGRKQASPAPDIIKKLVARLGSDDYREREETTRKLMDLDAALPALEEAVTSPDTEVRRRALLILSVLRPKVAERAFREFLPEAKEAYAFALLAYETWMRRPGNVPSATGASRPVILGKICWA